jgi:hypothetical protein
LATMLSGLWKMNMSAIAGILRENTSWEHKL